MTVANLTTIDTEKKFEALFRKYYAPIPGPKMVTAANIIGSSARIALAKPELTERITREILKVEKGKYVNKGAHPPSVAMSPSVRLSMRSIYSSSRSTTKAKLSRL